MALFARFTASCLTYFDEFLTLKKDTRTAGAIVFYLVVAISLVSRVNTVNQNLDKLYYFWSKTPAYSAEKDTNS